jgi:hypothetical protein
VVKRIAQLAVLSRFIARILAQPGARLNGCSPIHWQLKVRTRILHAGHLDHSSHFLGVFPFEGAARSFELRPTSIARHSAASEDQRIERRIVAFLQHWSEKRISGPVLM